jgi:hypothetical protein
MRLYCLILYTTFSYNTVTFVPYIYTIFNYYTHRQSLVSLYMVALKFYTVILCPVLGGGFSLKDINKICTPL